MLGVYRGGGGGLQNREEGEIGAKNLGRRKKMRCCGSREISMRKEF